MEKAILTCHGYTGYCEEMAPLGTFFEERGYEWLNLKLPGHETSPEDLKTKTWQDWTKYLSYEIESALTEYDSVLFGGLSMGAASTLWSLENYPEIKAGIALAPPYQILTGHRKLLSKIPFLGFWVEKGESDHLDVISDMGENHRSYKRHHTDSVKQLDKYVSHIRRNLSRITQPLIIIHGVHDRVIPHHDSERIIRDVSSQIKRLELVEGGHVLTRERDREAWFQLAYEFAEKQFD